MMLWAVFIGNRTLGPLFFDLQPGRGGDVTSQRYINQVLQPLVVPFLLGDGAACFSRITRLLTLPGQHSSSYSKGTSL